MLLLLPYLQLAAQTVSPAILTPEAFLQMVKLHHPVAKQASLKVDMANAAELAARGAFDPVIQTEHSRKTFDGTNYYFYNNPELKLQTAAALVIKTGVENNGGNYITNEASKGRTSYLGAELPLARGLLLDKYRANLQQARIYVNLSEQERLAMLNDLILDAYAEYWQWAGAWQQFYLYEKYINTAVARLQLMKTAWQNGDRAVMDTLEAYTQLEQYRLLQLSALQQLNETAIGLAGYSWQPGEDPWMIVSKYIPDTVRLQQLMALPDMAALIDQVGMQHPALKMYNYKISSLQVEKRLKFQGLLPELNLRANLLNKDYYALKGLDAALLQNNYKWGIGFKMPLLLREGMGSYRQAKLKIKETSFELDNKRREISNKIRQYFNDNFTLQQQLATIQQLMYSYQQLLRNEELKLRQGESSLFLVNSREAKLLELQQKQVEFRVKYIKSYYAISWAAGILPSQ
jgi:outer membrane protein TolC